MEISVGQSIKLALVHAVGLSQDALHIYVGLIVFVVVAVPSRQAGYLPLIAVVVTSTLGEVVDMRDDINSLGAWRWRASLHDLANTDFWPFVITLLVRARIFVAKQNKP